MSPVEIILMAGIFITGAFIIITVILTRLELGVGVWPILSAVSLFIVLHTYFQYVIRNEWLAQLFVLVAVLLFFFAALIKFWDILGYTKRYA